MRRVVGLFPIEGGLVTADSKTQGQFFAMKAAPQTPEPQKKAQCVLRRSKTESVPM